jgi:HEAT repeat protein
MKTLSMFFVAAFLTLAVTANAQDFRKELGAAKYDQAVANLLAALDTKNPGLMVSAIYRLGEFKAEKAVLPLMAILHKNGDERTRIAAAYSLCKIGAGVGTYAVKQAVRFDDNDKVKMQAAWYYNLLVNSGTFAFIPTETNGTIVAELK